MGRAVSVLLEIALRCARCRGDLVARQKIVTTKSGAREVLDVELCRNCFEEIDVLGGEDRGDDEQPPTAEEKVEK